MAVEGHGRPAGEAGDDPGGNPGQGGDPGADPGRGRLRGARLVRVVRSQQARPAPPGRTRAGQVLRMVLVRVGGP